MNDSFLLKHLPVGCNGAVRRRKGHRDFVSSFMNLCNNYRVTGTCSSSDLKICHLRFFRDSDSDADHHPVVEKVRERLSVSKHHCYID